MTKRSDDEFRLRPGRPRTRGDVTGKRFVSRVVKVVSQAGPERKRAAPSHASSKKPFGRGAVVARMHLPKLDVRARRVTVKLRLVNLRTASIKSTVSHLRYLQRDGVDQQGQPGVAYGPTDDQVDTQAFEVNSRGDRHQFRMIISPEDAAVIGDIKTFTRDWMKRMEQDLGTRLEWVAVDHWDTDNPHTHVVLRGKDQAGQDLIIARDYIAQGMRIRASELATAWLGPRTEKEIHESLHREMEQERWTNLDRVLQSEQRAGQLDLRAVPAQPDARLQRSLKLGRLQSLQRMGLAQEVSPGCWTMNEKAESVLRAMGERGDIIRTLQRALSGRQRDWAIHDGGSATDLVGRVMTKGLADELQDRGYLVVDGLDGRAHYVALPAAVELSDFPVGAIVRIRGQRAVDHAIASMAEHGIYRTDRHLAVLRTQSPSSLDPEAQVESHVRRLEALRRAGIVERMEHGVWRVPVDLAERGQVSDRQRQAGASVEVLCHLPIEWQARTIGATWLDRQLFADDVPTAETGFSGEVRTALRQRLAFLADEGFADRLGSRVVLKGNLLATLRDREVAGAADRLAAKSGLVYRPMREGQNVSGTYRRSLLLASGRFAMLEEGMGFSLVPWRPVMEKHLGRELRGVVRGAGVNWELSRSRGQNV